MRSLVMFLIVVLAAAAGGLVALPSDAIPNDLVAAQLPATTAPAAAAAATTTTASTLPTSVVTVLDEGARDEVRVVVANASGRPGAASETADALADAGFPDVTPADANERVEASVVYYADGFEDAGADVAAILGIDPDQVSARPDGRITVSDEPADVWVLVGTG